jgi:hypothetical protein
VSIAQVPPQEFEATPNSGVFLCREEALSIHPGYLFGHYIQRLGGFSLCLDNLTSQDGDQEEVNLTVGDPLIDVMNHLGESIVDITVSVVAHEQDPGALVARFHPRRDK